MYHRFMRKHMLVGLVMGWLAAVAVADEGLPVIVPDNLERLDPLVIGLIQRHVAVVRQRPAAGDAHGELALVYEANNLWPEARAALENATRLAPDEWIWSFHLALARRETGDFDGALSLFATLARQQPNFAPGWQRLGEAYLESGQLPKARQAFERLIELKGDLPHGYTGLGDVLLRQGQAEAAAGVLERAVKLAPEYRAARYLLGTAYLRLRRAEDARRELELGTGGVLDPLPDPLTSRVQSYAMSLTAQLSRAGALLNANQPDRAVAILEEVRQAHPRNLSVLNNLAIAYLRLNRLDEARARLDEALSINDSKFTTYLNLTSWAMRARQLDQALTYADDAVARAPEMAQTHYSRAQVLANLNRFDEALASLARSLEFDAQNSSAATFSGDLCLHLKRYVQARTHYQNAIRIAPKFVPARVGLARAQIGLGNREAARAALIEARKTAPNHPLVQRLAGDMLKLE